MIGVTDPDIMERLEFWIRIEKELEDKEFALTVVFIDGFSS